MKRFEDYHEEYKNAVDEGMRKSKGADGYVVKECVFISMKWQTENNWNPWDVDAIERLQELKGFDEVLYNAVIGGLEIVISGMKKK